MNTLITKNFLPPILTALGICVALVGLVVMAGWLVGSSLLVQIQPEFATMKFNTALCFLLTGLSISAIKYHKAIFIRCCGITISILAILSLIQWIFDINLLIDNLLIQDKFEDPTAPPGRMSFATSLCFLLSGIALTLLTFRHISSYFIEIVSAFGSIILALGMIGLFDYALSLYTDYGWQQFTVMAIHTTSCFLLVGIALVLIALFDGSHSRVSFSAGIIPAVSVLVILCLSLSIALENNNTKHVKTVLKAQLNNQVEQTKSDINFITNALARGIKRWEMQLGQISQYEWQADAQLYVETLPHLISLSLLDDSFRPLWQATKDSSLSITELEDIVIRIPTDTNKTPQAFGITTPQSNNIVVLILPFSAEGKAKHDLLAVIDFSTFFKELTQTDVDESTWLNIKAGPDILFSTLTPLSAAQDAYSATQQAVIQGLEFEFEKGFSLESNVSGLGILSSTVFITGCLFIGVMFLAIYTSQKSRRLTNIINSEKERFRLVLEAAPGAMLLVDTQGNIEFSNTKVELLFGYEPKSLLGENVDILVPSAHRGHHAQLRHSYTQNPQFRSMAKNRELHGVHKNGQLIPVEIELCPIHTDQGLKILASIFDLSERTKQLVALKNSKEELDRAGRIAKIGAWEFNLNSKVVHWSTQTYKIHEVPESEPLTFEFATNFFSKSDLEVLNQAIEDAILKGTEWDLELPLTTLSGNLIWVRTQGQVEYENGQAVRLVGAIQDITEKHLVTLELERRNLELNNFAYVASHDLKSPLRGIDQLATWLTDDLRDSIDHQTKEHLRLIRSRINRMENLLDDLLAYARAGRKDAMTECVNVAELVQQTFKFCNVNDAFTLDLRGDTGDYLLVKTPLETVLRNLINNAIKHHDQTHGQITIEIKADVKHLEITVADDGPGIALEHRDKAFAMFQTLQPRDKVEGSGMGLAIVKKVVESFGGSIELSQNQPRGALFRFSFPARYNPK